MVPSAAPTGRTLCLTRAPKGLHAQHKSDPCLLGHFKGQLYGATQPFAATTGSYRCDLGLDALPKGSDVVLVLGGRRVPHSDHVVADAQRQTANAHRREGQGVDVAPQGGQGPTAAQGV